METRKLESDFFSLVDGTEEYFVLLICQHIMSNWKDGVAVTSLQCLLHHNFLANVFQSPNLHIYCFFYIGQKSASSGRKTQIFKIYLFLAFPPPFSDVILQNAHKNGEMET